MQRRNIRFRTFLKNTVHDVLKARGWSETDSETDWDLFWADVGWMHECFDHIHLSENQRVNHFRNHYELTRKDLLIKNLKRARKALEKEDRLAEAAKYDFFPQTYVLPAEYSLFVEEFKKSQGGVVSGVWIMKPVGKAQGKGIFLFNKLAQISDWKKDHKWRSVGQQTQPSESYIVQRYIDNPYLIGGKKFDLRIYALVVNYAPLRVYLYRSGFARFSNSRFSMKKEDIVNNYIHLTNFAVQKTAPTYDPATGTKWPLASLKQYLVSRHGSPSVNELFFEIQMLIIRSLLAVQNIIINDRHCFEIYGYDILIDDQLKPWLLEVNASPSLSSDTPQDYDLKFGMLDDAMTLVDMEHRLTGMPTPEQVGGFDLIWDHNQLIHGNKSTSLPTLLGCANERERQLKKLFASVPRKS